MDYIRPYSMPTHSYSKKRRGVAVPIIAAGYHTLDSISTNDPRPRWDVSVRLILESFESGSFSNENKRRISKFPVAPNHSVRGYVNCNIDYWNDKKCEKSCRTGKNAHNATSSVAKGAVNQLLTIRNWVIGCYPQICATLSHKLQGIDFFPEKKLLLRKIRGTICETVSRKLQMIDRSKYSINTLSLRIVEKNFDEICDSLNHKFITPPDVLMLCIIEP